MPDLPGAVPHPTECPICGKVGEEIVFLGLHDFYEACPRCGIRAYGGFERPQGRGKAKECPACGKQIHRIDTKRVRIQKGENVTKVCKSCLAEMAVEEKRQQEIVEAGGIYWQCSICGRHGVILPDAEIAKDFRATTQGGRYGLPNPDGKYPPCAIDFGGSDECPGCNKEHPCHKETARWERE